MWKHLTNFPNNKCWRSYILPELSSFVTDVIIIYDQGNTNQNDNGILCGTDKSNISKRLETAIVSGGIVKNGIQSLCVGILSGPASMANSFIKNIKISTLCRVWKKTMSDDSERWMDREAVISIHNGILYSK